MKRHRECSDGADGFPLDLSWLTRWCKRIGQEGVEWLLTKTIEAGRGAGVISERSSEAVIVDTTVMKKAIAQRKFPSRVLHVDNMASASFLVLNLTKDKYVADADTMLSHINVGTDTDIFTLELAQIVAKVTGFTEKSLPIRQNSMEQCIN